MCRGELHSDKEQQQIPALHMSSKYWWACCNFTGSSRLYLAHTRFPVVSMEWVTLCLGAMEGMPVQEMSRKSDRICSVMTATLLRECCFGVGTWKDRETGRWAG